MPASLRFLKLRQAMFVIGLWSGVDLSIASGQVTVYTDEASFLAAAAEAGTFAFTDDLNSGTVSRVDVTISGSGIAAFPNTNSTNTVDGTGYLRFAVNSDRPLTFTFGAEMIAFGFQTNPRSEAAGVGDSFAVTLSNGGSTSYSMPLTDTTEFRGFVASVGFTSITISDSGDASDLYGIDNLVAYSATAVPEPSHVALGAGVLAMVWAGWRRRTNQKALL